MIKIKRILLVVLCLLSLTLITNAESLIIKENPSTVLDTIKLAKTASTDTEVSVIGKLIVENGKIMLKDSSDKVELLFPNGITRTLYLHIGFVVKVTGTIQRGFWYYIGIGHVKFDVKEIENSRGVIYKQ